MPPPAHQHVTAETRSAEAFACFRLPAAAGQATVMLVGHLDLVTADRARAAIRLAQDESTTVICDLGDVWFVDVSGLRVLLDATAHARLTGDRLEIANCPPIVPRMLELLRLEHALELRPPAPRANGSARFRRRVA